MHHVGEINCQTLKKNTVFGKISLPENVIHMLIEDPLLELLELLLFSCSIKKFHCQSLSLINGHILDHSKLINNSPEGFARLRQMDWKPHQELDLDYQIMICTRKNSGHLIPSKFYKKTKAVHFSLQSSEETNVLL